MRTHRGLGVLAALAALTPVATGATTLPDGRTLTPAGTLYTTTGDFPSQAVLGTGALGPTLMVSDTGQDVNYVESFDAATPTVHSAVAGTATVPPATNAAPWANSGSIALSPSGTTAYVGGGELDVVRAFSVAVPTVQTATYTIGAFAGNVAVSNDGTRLYASQTFDGSQHFDKGHTIVEYTIATGTTRTAGVGRDPMDIAVAPAAAPAPALAVVNRDDASVSILNPATLTPVATVAVDRQPAVARFTADGSRLLVLCSLDDSVVVINTATWAPIEHISLRPLTGIGAGPSDLTIDPATGTTAYVALSADNAVAVLQRPSTDSDQWLLAGKIPTARYPTGVVVDTQHHQLLVIDGKGAGTPTAGGDTPGAVEAIPIPSQAALSSSTAQVEQNNSGTSPSDCVSPGVAAIQHVVYIIRENKTYDEEFGDMPGGDPAYLMYPNANTPNTHALASQYALMENFNTEQEVSDTGHEVVMGSVANDFMERNVQQSYGLDGVPRQGPELGGDADTGWSPTNYLLDSALTANLDFRDYGEFYRRDQSVGTATEDQALSPALGAHIEYGFPGFGFNPNVKDTDRFTYWNAQFQQDKAADHMPQLEVIYLPEDHTDSSNGVPPQEQVADSDLATGQIVEALSHSQFWESTAVFLTEDDPQSGMDHVDYHRTIGLVAGPHVKSGYETTTHFDQAGMLRTIEEILGLPTLTEHDATATPLDELFTATPNDTPFTAVGETVPSPGAAAGVAAQYASTFGAGADPANLPPEKQFAFQWQMTHGSPFVTPSTSPGNDLAAPPAAVATDCVPRAVLGESPVGAAAGAAGLLVLAAAAVGSRHRRRKKSLTHA